MPSERDAQRIMELLSDAGFSIVGPVDRASTALALAAQSPVNFAVVGSRLQGRRDGHELAGELERTWGAASIVIEPEPVGAGDLALRARAILAGEYDPPPAAA